MEGGDFGRLASHTFCQLYRQFLYYGENRFEYVINEVKNEIKILWLRGSAVVENGMRTFESR